MLSLTGGSQEPEIFFPTRPERMEIYLIIEED